MLMQCDAALVYCTKQRNKFDRESWIRMNDRLKLIQHLDLEIELFGYLPHDTISRRFIFHELSAGEFPFPPLVLIYRTLCDEDFFVADNKGAGNFHLDLNLFPWRS